MVNLLENEKSLNERTYSSCYQVEPKQILPIAEQNLQTIQGLHYVNREFAWGKDNQITWSSAAFQTFALPPHNY